MKIGKKISKNRLLFIFGVVIIIMCGIFLFLNTEKLNTNKTTPQANVYSSNLVKYTGTVPHIFFHSLIIYPDKAYSSINAKLYENNMITVDEFKTILNKLYENNFVLIDSRILYKTDAKGEMSRQDIYIPGGKKPLVLSIDDLNYYRFMRKSGFAEKLVLDGDTIKTTVEMPEGGKINTEDGDVVPIIEVFIREHPDFSFNGARGIIGLTGFEGVLGYRTHALDPIGLHEREKVAPLIVMLKKKGWIFASHSFSHGHNFFDRTISTDELAQDLDLWNKNVATLVGDTHIYIGPFGEIFTKGDHRRKMLIDAGFHVLYGVGMDTYMSVFDDHIVMDRIDIDGLRLRVSKKELHDMLGI